MHTTWLDAHPFVNQYTVLRHDQEGTFVFIKLQIEFVDGSLLHTKEYTDIDTRKYSFHWQRADGTWLVRWDNGPALSQPQFVSSP